MFQRDYILRLVEMMGDLARRVAELMDELDQMKLLDDKLRELCGMPLRAIEELSAESLCEMLAPKPRLFASETLYIRAMLTHADCERDALLYKSLRLLGTLHDEGPLCEARLARMRELKAATLPMLDGDDLMNCARFFSQAESYGDMEDAIFEALDRAADDGARDGFASEGAAMLRAAAHADERTLAFCCMTGSELRESARELEQRLEKR